MRAGAAGRGAEAGRTVSSAGGGAGGGAASIGAEAIDAVWTDRPLPPTEAAEPHPLVYAGRSSEDKRADVAKLLRDAKQDAADPNLLAWEQQPDEPDGGGNATPDAIIQNYKTWKALAPKIHTRPASTTPKSSRNLARARRS